MSKRNDELFPKKRVWYIEASTGCSCCQNENFSQGFYFDLETPSKIVELWSTGVDNPLASQFSRHGRYVIQGTEAEILPDGRMIIEDNVFDSDQLDDLRICW